MFASPLRRVPTKKKKQRCIALSASVPVCCSIPRYVAAKRKKKVQLYININILIYPTEPRVARTYKEKETE